MLLPLEHWQDRLYRHFKSLSSLRAASGLPIFALEHGLTTEEVTEISSLLQAHASSGKRLSTYWLLWVVYATEIGYGYTGDEYWQSFEEQTPGWQFHHRNSLRNWFRKFQSTYHGVRPSGAWAENFPIIAWPITHAIVPKYLQYQFARALYQLRFHLAGLNTLGSLSVGRLLATHTYDATTRFEKFLQQQELTGRIVLGLLGEAPSDGQGPIYADALQRIITDLETVRSTRGWLKEARRTVIDRFKGIGKGAGPSVWGEDSSGRDRAVGHFRKPDIRPIILLRYSGAGKWAVAMEIPSFGSVAALNPGLRSFLKRTRCRLAGATDTKPAGWVLSGSRIGVLKSWPHATEPLVKFEKPHAVLNGLLQTDCLLSAGPVWLFRLGPDGRAREIRGHNVHPGAEYILVTTGEFASDSPLLTSCEVDCVGVRAVRISVPENLTGEETAQINVLGLEVARTVQVWPAGLPCRKWDGDGQSEWLTTESPRFGMVHDHPVTSYAVRLNDNTGLTVAAPDVGQPVFVELSPLPVGKHLLTVTAQRDASRTDASQQPTLDGFVELSVREPEPWSPGTPAHTGLIVMVDPHDADLDDFWANDIDLSIAGPESHSVTCTVSLEAGSGDQILYEKAGQALRLPVKSDAWRKRFAPLVQREEAVWRYLEATTGSLHIDGGELGKYVLRFERDVLPVRWVTRLLHRKVFLRLIDDTGLETDQAKCQVFRMERPTQAEIPSVSNLLEGISPPLPGGLFVARHGDHGADIVVSSGLAAGEGFQGLGINTDFSDIENGSTSVAVGLRILESWANARLVGIVADYRRTQITRDFLAAIYSKLCGSNWADAETAFRKNPNSRHCGDVLQRRVGKNKSFNAVLRKDHAQLRDDVTQSSRWYADLTHRYGVCSDGTLCQFAVRLATEPHNLPSFYDTDLDSLTRKAASNPEILRGARFATLLCSAKDAFQNDNSATRRRR